MALLGHALNLLAKKTIRATIAFGEPMPATGDRQQLSQTLHRAVLRLHQQLRSSGKTGLVDSAAAPPHSE
jgi:hypothetical protein